MNDFAGLQGSGFVLPRILPSFPAGMEKLFIF